MNEQAVFLDCVWETDKFVLHESVSRSEPEREDREIGEESVGASLIQYQSIEVLLGGKSLHGISSLYTMASCR